VRLALRLVLIGVDKMLATAQAAQHGYAVAQRQFRRLKKALTDGR
jgi:hypothetical protein